MRGRKATQLFSTKSCVPSCVPFFCPEQRITQKVLAIAIPKNLSAAQVKVLEAFENIVAKQWSNIDEIKWVEFP